MSHKRNKPRPLIYYISTDDGHGFYLYAPSHSWAVDNSAYLAGCTNHKVLSLTRVYEWCLKAIFDDGTTCQWQNYSPNKTQASKEAISFAQRAAKQRSTTIKYIYINKRPTSINLTKGASL